MYYSTDIEVLPSLLNEEDGLAGFVDLSITRNLARDGVGWPACLGGTPSPF